MRQCGDRIEPGQRISRLTNSPSTPMPTTKANISEIINAATAAADITVTHDRRQCSIDLDPTA
jgi:hypothetical protein